MMHHRTATTRRAALLLEVIVALTIMVFSLSVIASQLVGGMQMVQDVDRQTRAIQFTDRMLALLELDPEAIAQIGEEQQIDGDFGRQYPGWFWRASLQNTGTEGLGLITLEILAMRDTGEEGSLEEARVVRAVRMLKAAPQPIDLVADFGVSEEQVAVFAENSPFPELDPTALNPQLLAQLIQPETLMEILPALMPMLAQMGGGQLPADFSPEMLTELLAGGGELPFAPGGGGGGPLAGIGNGGGGRGGGPRGGGPGGQNDVIRGMIEGALGDQVSGAELDQLMESLNGGTGTSGNGGRGIRDLADDRNAQNEVFTGRPGRGGGRGGRGGGGGRGG